MFGVLFSLCLNFNWLLRKISILIITLILHISRSQLAFLSSMKLLFSTRARLCFKKKYLSCCKQFLIILNTIVVLGFWIGEYSWCVDNHWHTLHNLSHTPWHGMYGNMKYRSTHPTKMLMIANAFSLAFSVCVYFNFVCINFCKINIIFKTVKIVTVGWVICKYVAEF